MQETMVDDEKIEVLEEPSRTLSSFVKGYTYMPVKVRRKA